MQTWEASAWKPLPCRQGRHPGGPCLILPGTPQGHLSSWGRTAGQTGAATEVGAAEGPCPAASHIGAAEGPCPAASHTRPSCQSGCRPEPSGRAHRGQARLRGASGKARGAWKAGAPCLPDPHPSAPRARAAPLHPAPPTPVRILCLPCPGGPPMTAGGYGGTPATLLPTLPGRGAVSQEGFSHHRSSELLPSLQLPGQALLGPPALPRPRGWSSSFRSSASEGVSSGSLNTHTSQNIFSSQPSSPCLPSGPAALDSHGCRDFSRQQSP